ncbi:2-deoxy-5-keto-D-gluconate 6-phosphate aldolase domain-containing protein [Paractinoplanes lichenicola]|uniref:DUF2090 domain-containing protein n=1 Tax=Paractinoplanes lichenicola TaxID=2802976 RepID=A0ABS1VYC8_9ACTN|nr:DUF2090 domain-containing protein [Actinoplanes lichenicola]MBL7259465.1 DUF2090 domain-containing protein [Actinoplanes lichenicola]
MSLLILAVDQRPWLTQALYGHTGTALPAERAAITDGKHMVLEGLLAALAADPSLAAHAGILVDEQLGAGVPERARANRVTLSMPVEQGGLALYETEPDDLPGFLAHFRPELPKVLVRYNPAGDADDNKLQLSRLAKVSQAVRDAGGRFLFELLVPPLDAQRSDTFETSLRPQLILQAMEEIVAEVPVDVWKLEHMGAGAHYRAAADLAAQTGGECILLGANAPRDTVDGWLTDAAANGFTGFAIGRSIWWDSMRGLLAGDLTRPEAVAAVAANYRHFAGTFLR